MKKLTLREFKTRLVILIIIAAAIGVIQAQPLSGWQHIWIGIKLLDAFLRAKDELFAVAFSLCQCGTWCDLHAANGVQIQQGFAIVILPKHLVAAKARWATKMLRLVSTQQSPDELLRIGFIHNP